MTQKEKNYEELLGKWAVIDIETTGADAGYDDIIDIGFLQFEGKKLIRTYSSLVRTDKEISFFIQKLTNITPTMNAGAPLWSAVEPEVMDLFGHSLLAHNSSFEEAFLKEHFDRINDGTGRESYEDSLIFLATLFPNWSSLKLEEFIIKFGIAEKEDHRGFQDSVDLLKVVLVACSLVHQDLEHKQLIHSLYKKYGFEKNWYYKFFCLDHLDYQEISEQFDFDLDEAVDIAKAALAQEVSDEVDYGSSPKFDLGFSGDNIKNIYRDEKQIREVFPNYTYRKSQEDLSLKMGQSFKNGIHSLVQAPTGTGKTLGYLLPASLFAMSEEKQVLVATGTKTLQHQAMSKDVPQLRKLLGLDESTLRVKRLVGSNNHLCELLFRNSNDEEDLLWSSKDESENWTNLYFELLFFFNGRASSNDVVLRADLPYVLKMKLDPFKKREKEIGVDFRACTGNQCPFKGECTYIRGLREAKDAHIVIGNHSLMFSWPRAFPRPDIIVVDEAHKIEEETTKSFSLEVTGEELDTLSRNLTHLQGLGSLFYLLAQNEAEVGESTPVIGEIRESANQTNEMLKDHILSLPDSLETYFKKKPRYTDTFWNELPMIPEKGRHDQLSMSIRKNFESIHYIVQTFYETLIPYAARWEVKSLDDEQQIIALTRFETFMGQLEDITLALKTALEGLGGFTHTLRYHERDGYSLLCAPINVGQILHDQLLQTTSSVVYTSATLGNAKGDQGSRGIEWSTGYSYLEPDKRFKSGYYLPATYDYENNTRVFLCDDTPPFYDRDFIPSTLKPVLKLIRDLGGRSLLLFSARARFEIAREVLLKEFDGEIPIFVQGMGNNVVEEFKNAGNGVLIGMESFGEGIDVPGEALQFIFVDKIPDLRMDKVINDRRDFYEANLGNEFTDYYLAHRTRSLHQKLGRLVRTEKDIGGVIIVDSRIKKWKGRTMEKLVKLMEPYKLQRSSLENACDGVRDFLEEKGHL